MKPLPYGHCINPETMKLVTDEELAKLQTEPIATAGEEKGEEPQYSGMGQALCNESDKLYEKMHGALPSPSPASTDPHAGSNISARCVRGEHTECEFGVLCECECHKETRQESDDSWNAVAASGEREEIQRWYTIDDQPSKSPGGDFVLFSDVEAMQKRHQLARAQDKARIAGLENMLRAARDSATLTPRLNELINAELNRNTKK